MNKDSVKSASFFELVDNWLDKKLKKSLFCTEFYIKIRKDKKILLDKDGKTIGGKWSFYTENRKKLPRGYMSLVI